MEWGELLISLRAFAALSRDSGSKPDPLGSSGSGLDLLEFDEGWFAGESDGGGEGEGEEE